MDLPSLPYEILKRRMEDAMLSQARKSAGVIAGLATNTIASELRLLQSNIESALEFINRLPEDAKRAAAYEFFSSFFSHYLPKKFLRHYIYGSGSPPSLVLTEREMIDCNPNITVHRCRGFSTSLARISLGKIPASVPLRFDCPANALTNGTLGQFTVRMNANLTWRAMDDWLLCGTMSFYDEWDFDPKDFQTGGRSFQGELKTRFAHHTLPGRAFIIESEQVKFQQDASNATVVWSGGEPVASRDRIAELDFNLKNLE